MTLHSGRLIACQSELAMHLQVVLPMLTRHVDKAAYARNTTAVEYVRAVMYAQGTLPQHVGWETFYLRATGTPLLTYLVRSSPGCRLVITKQIQALSVRWPVSRAPY